MIDYSLWKFSQSLLSIITGVVRDGDIVRVTTGLQEVFVVMPEAEYKRLQAALETRLSANENPPSEAEAASGKLEFVER